MNETSEAGTTISFYLWFISMAIDYNLEYFIYTAPGKFLNVQYQSHCSKSLWHFVYFSPLPLPWYYKFILMELPDVVC